jgi:1-acyl-sn-glycerol-3-phosphate acyltransferase
MQLYLNPNQIGQRNREFIARLGELVQRVFVPWHQFEMRGLPLWPKGPALIVGNHNGGLLTIDTFLVGHAVYRAYGEVALPYGLAHDRVMQLPGLNWLLVSLGALCASHENAAQLFGDGQCVMVYPGGEIEAFRPHQERHRIDFGGRTGYIRLALRHGVPIVPVVAGGAHSTFVVLRDLPGLVKALQTERWLRSSRWPLTFSLPWGLTPGPPPPYLPLPAPIIAEVLPAITFARTGPEAAADSAYVRECANQVESTMQQVLSRIGPEAESRGWLAKVGLGG